MRDNKHSFKKRFSSIGKWFREVFSFFKITKQIENEEQLRTCRSTQFLVRFLMLLLLVGGVMMLIGGVMCIATFKVDKTTSVLLIVFGIVCTLLGSFLLLILKNITTRIDVYKKEI